MTSEAFDFARHLVELDTARYKAAVEHPFICDAGNGTLSAERMRAWLGQDRLFVKAYLNFMGGMLYTIPKKGLDALLLEECLLALGDACGNAAREVRFFTDIASSYGLPRIHEMPSDLPNEATARYLAFMDQLVEESKGNADNWIVAWIALWAMEIVYMNAWTHAKGLSVQARSVHWEQMIANWTSPEFQRFVENLRVIMNQLVHARPGVQRKAEAMWREILDLEVHFFNNGSR